MGVADAAFCHLARPLSSTQLARRTYLRRMDMGIMKPAWVLRKWHGLAEIDPDFPAESARLVAKPVISLLILVLAALIALVLHRWLRYFGRRLLARRSPLLFSIISQMRGVTRLVLLMLALIIAISVAPIDPEVAGWLSRLLLVAMVGLVGWTTLTAVHIAADLYLRRFHVDTAACALITFDTVRQYGYSLFASAGVAGIVAGFAARPALSNLFAGVQLALTQPIRLQDVVIVEGEWGTIEEITSTYVVVRIWDLRRLIVPLSYFIEKPFQNWTRENATLIGSVIFHLYYRAPISAMREKLKEICANSKNWNDQVLALQSPTRRKRPSRCAPS
jgi:small-conductance mechanosensitive channel